jgi:hypothetical protein
MRPHTAEEAALLEANLRAAGICRDPLVLWAGHDILLEGHLRLKLCEKLGIPYHTTTVQLPDRAAARRWVIDQQRGRRNLTKEEDAYYRGQRYLASKQPHGGDRSQPGASAHGEHMRTADKIGKQESVSPATVRRDAEYAKALDKVAEVCGGEAKDALLAGKVSRTEMIALARLEPEPLKKAAKELLAGKAGTPKAGTLSKEQKAKAPKPGARSGKPPATISLPTAPAAFAAALKVQLGPEKALQICLALCRAFGLEVKEGPPQQTTPPKDRPKKSGGKVAAKAKGKRGTHKSKARS